MAYIRVAYRKRDIDFDYVPGNRLEGLIAKDEITHFFRPGEKRWVSVKFDAVRRKGGEEYPGMDRRRNDRAIDPEAQNSSLNEETSPRDWLERLWREIEGS